MDAFCLQRLRESALVSSMLASVYLWRHRHQISAFRVEQTPVKCAPVLVWARFPWSIVLPLKKCNEAGAFCNTKITEIISAPQQRLSYWKLFKVGATMRLMCIQKNGLHCCSVGGVSPAGRSGQQIQSGGSAAPAAGLCRSL